MDEYPLVFIVISLLFSAFFSGIEIAFVSANKLKIELDNQQGTIHGKILSKFSKTPEKFIAAMLLGNNTALVIYGIFMALILEPTIQKFIADPFIILILQTLISTLIVLFTAEFLPKVIFIINPNNTLKILAIPVWIVYWILFPFTQIILLLSNGILKLFGTDTSQSDMAFSKNDLTHLMDDLTETQETEEAIDHEIKIFKNALDFSDVKARECMIPRTEIIAVDIESKIDTLKNLFIETGLSKILVYRDNIDNIIGYVHSFDLFKMPESIKEILLPISIFPESMSASEALNQFIKQHRSIAVVVDEYGGTSGMLTIEDVIEEIFGEIEDEHDKEDLIEKQLNENEYLFSARIEIDYLNTEYGFNLPESEEYETLAGYLLHISENIPDKNDIIKTDNYNFLIEEVSDNKIITVKIIKKEA